MAATWVEGSDTIAYGRKANVFQQVGSHQGTPGMEYLGRSVIWNYEILLISERIHG
jgi:hypothetical protein